MRSIKKTYNFKQQSNIPKTFMWAPKQESEFCGVLSKADVAIIKIHIGSPFFKN